MQQWTAIVEAIATSKYGLRPRFIYTNIKEIRNSGTQFYHKPLPDI